VTRLWLCFATVLLVSKISFEKSGPSPDCNEKLFGWTFLVVKRDQRSAFTSFKNLKAKQKFVKESWM
jgi:hypothetical protein